MVMPKCHQTDRNGHNTLTLQEHIGKQELVPHEIQVHNGAGCKNRLADRDYNLSEYLKAVVADWKGCNGDA